MKTDPLEDFIRSNRDQFDDLEPSPEIWLRIHKSQQQPRIRHWRSNLMKAAAIAAVFALGYLFSVWVGQQSPETTVVAEQKENIPELQMLHEARIYYSSMIADREQQVYLLTADNKQLQTEIMEEFEHLDRAFKSLENDLTDQIANEEVIEAMIQHYRIKLDALEDILYQLKSAKQADKEEVRHVL
jgi:PAS domain-containing protein